MKLWPITSRTRLNLWLIFAIFLLAAATLEVWSQMTAFRFFQTRLTSLCDAAIEAYQQRGQSGLSSTIEAARTMVGIQIRILGDHGMDLADGTDKSALLTAAQRTGWPIPARQPPPLLLKSDGSRVCIATPGSLPAQPRAGALWGLPFACLACCAIAIFVTVRSRRLEDALVQFGSGHLEFRMQPASGDALSRLSAAFNEMAERIEALVKANRRLCADISHELRSPLARIRLSTQMVRDGEGGALDRVDREAERMNDLIGELLDVSRAEADADSLRPEAVPMDPFLNEIAEECRIEAESRQCSITVSAVPAVYVQADPDLLRRALDNIMRNAIQHSPAGSTIQVTAKAHDGMAVVVVRDQGPGVPEGTLDRIFDPFFRVDQECTDQSGTGLGLALAKRAIEVHHGTIRALNCWPGLSIEISIPVNGSP